jgi:hypothetical protein
MSPLGDACHTDVLTSRVDSGGGTKRGRSAGSGYDHHIDSVSQASWFAWSPPFRSIQPVAERNRT